MGGEKRGHGGGGRGGGGKKGKYMDKGGSSAVIPFGIRGFFLSCENGKESRTAHQMKDAVLEIYKTLVPKEEGKEGAAAAPAADDIQASLAAEVAELKETKDDLLKKLDHESGKGLCFIKMKWAEDGPTPPQLALKLMEEIHKTREKKSRFCMRFMPIEQTCFAGKDEIAKAATELIAKHFPTDEGVAPIKFSVLFEKRAHNTLDRMETINMVAQLVPKPHTVDLTAPDKTILVSLIKSVCLLSVVDKYMEYCKYNVSTLSMTDEEKAAMVKQSQENQKPPKAKTADSPAPAPDASDAPPAPSSDEKPDESTAQPAEPEVTPDAKTE